MRIAKLTHAEQIVRQLRCGQISSKEEATRQLVAGILREKVRIDSTVLTQKICEQLQTDPLIHRALDRLWSATDGARGRTVCAADQWEVH